MRWTIFSKLGGSSIDPFLIIFFCFFLGLHRYHKFEACLFLHISGFIIQNHFGSFCLMVEIFLKEFLEISKSTYHFLSFSMDESCVFPHLFSMLALHGSPWHHPKPFHFGSDPGLRKNELPKITTQASWPFQDDILHVKKRAYIYIYNYIYPSNPNHLEVCLNFRCKTTPLPLDQNLHNLPPFQTVRISRTCRTASRRMRWGHSQPGYLNLVNNGIKLLTSTGLSDFWSINFSKTIGLFFHIQILNPQILTSHQFFFWQFSQEIWPTKSQQDLGGLFSKSSALELAGEFRGKLISQSESQQNPRFEIFGFLLVKGGIPASHFFWSSIEVFKAWQVF